MGVNTTLLFFLLLIPLSGLIAFVGDRIGHRMGKRRHSLLGLRPRHTAMVFTIGSGMGISLLMFCLMYASSETFREVLARGTELKRLNKTLEQRNGELTTANETADRRINALNIEAKQAELAKTQAEKARKDAVSRQAEAESKTKQAAEALRKAEANLATERTKLGTASSALEGAEAKVRDARERLTTANAASQAARAEANTAQKRVQQAQLRIHRAEDDLASAKERVAKANSTFDEVTKFQHSRIARQTTQLYQQETKLNEQSRLLSERSAQLEAQNVTAERQRMEVARLTKEVDELEQKRMESQRQLAAVTSSAQALRDTRIIYRVGEEIDRISIAPTSSVYRVQNRLEALMTTGGKKAETRGAARGGDLGRAVVIPTRSSGAESMNEEDVLREVSNAVRKGNENVVVILLSSENAVVGEPVRSDLRILRNPLILKEGAVLGEILLPDTRVRQDTADRLYAFLRGEVRDNLLKAGAIPPALGGDAEASLVTLSGDEWLSLLDEARQAGWRARVTVRIARDLRAADAVRLTFDIKGLPAVATDRQQ
ncbi:MAG: DUF3084 domain-containing protein [Armatimonas sp.]